MPEKSGPTPGSPALDLRLSVPAAGGRLRDIASELAARVAEHLGTAAPDAQSLGAAIEGLASRLGGLGAAADGDGENITFSFRQLGAELVIEARCCGESSEVRHPLPA